MRLEEPFIEVILL